MVCFTLQLFLLAYLHVNMGPPGPPATASPTQSSIRCLAVCPLHPCCPPPPLLLVWMNVSSLTLWLSVYSSIFCHFGLFFVFKFVALFIVQGGKMYLPVYLHLGWKSSFNVFLVFSQGVSHLCLPAIGMNLPARP